MKKILRQSLLTLCIAGLSVSVQAKTTLTFWNGFTGPDRQYIVDMIDLYNQSHENIEIKMEVMPWDSLYQKLVMALPSGQGPDLVAFDSIYISTYAQSQFLVPLTDLYQSGQVDSKVMPKALYNSIQYKGIQYGVPFNFATLVLYYNKTMFKEAGLNPDTPPTTWDELEKDALKLTKTRAEGGKQQYGFEMATKETVQVWPVLVWNGGGHLITEGQASINSPENKATFTRWCNLIIKNKISPPTATGAQADKLFETGKAAMMMNGPWAAPGFKKANLDFGMAQIPAGPGGHYTLGTSVSATITSSSKHIAEAKNFLEWWNSHDSQLTYALKSGFPPTRLDIKEDELKQNPYVGVFLKAATNSHFYLQGQKDIPSIESDILVPMYESILLQDKTVEEALDTANSQLKARLAGK